MNSKFNGMPSWTLSDEKCPATMGFVGLTMTPGKIGATTKKEVPKKQSEEK